MVTFSNILSEAEKMWELSSNFNQEYLNGIMAYKPNTTIGAPAPETNQGEQKIPTVKPNGITR
jgi:hypothetical protein